MMNRGVNMESVAEQVGGQGVEKLVTDAERICTYEARRIGLENEPAIVRLQAEGAILVAEERRIAERLQSAPPMGDRRRLFWRRIYYWSVALLLAVTGFFAITLSLAPFRLGWISWLISAGMAALTPFLIDKLLEHTNMEHVLKVLTVIAAVTSLASIMLFAVIRGDLLAQQIREAETQAVVIDDAAPQPQAPDNFYDRATALLCAALLLMAFATEVGGGLILHEAWRSMPDESEDWAGLRRELVRIRGCMAEIAYQIVALRNAPQAFEATYWRDFHRALLLNATRSAMTKLLVGVIAFLAFASPKVWPQSRVNLVIAIDLTQSVAATGPDGKSDFEKNVEGVARVLAQIQPGTRLTVIGITDQSFAEPYILIRAQVPDDPGYFGERVTAARGQLVRAWQQKGAQLKPNFKQTDMFGALELASQLYAENPKASPKELIIFSDMRESVPGLDFERMSVMAALGRHKGITVPDLRNVQVYAVGVDGAGKSTGYWQSLLTFWREYVARAGAQLRTYSVTREMSQDVGELNQ